MALDPVTVLTLTALLAVIVGLLLILSWAQNRAFSSLAAWGIGNVVGGFAAGGLVMRGALPDYISITLANALLAIGYGMMWAGCRWFEGKQAVPSWIGAGAALWVCACSIPAFFGSPALRISLISAIVAAYTADMVLTLWRGRTEHLVSRMPAVVWLTMHALIYATRIPLALFGDVPPTITAQSPWIAFITLESLIHIVAMAILMVSMAKERSESEQHKAAAIDELTGAVSRRQFFSEGEKQLEQTLSDRHRAALLLFDLDWFKVINDTYGHAVGDRALKAFSGLAGSILRPGDLFARLGGEEFAALIVHVTEDVAVSIAERFRDAVQALALDDADRRVRLSVSIGVATVNTAGLTLAELIKSADQALYSAKAEGRNCVRISRERLPPLRAVS
jgi:diguanylate cyclase (GGDEF)-like protein